MSIKAIVGLFSPSRIEVAKSIRNRGMNFKNLPVLNSIAEKQDVFVSLAESKKDPRLINMKIFRRGIDHVSDIPEYALEHQTGDQIYINWERKIDESDVSPFALEDRMKKVFGHND
ncbi:MAG: hypothetical protein E7Z92_04565 [Cyanobacteria bacterium SIG31]|nr:hypothetical protein [Cyanobacteria bacterium SIG31]